MSLRKKAVKGVVWTAINNWGTQAISFVVFSLLARLLEPATFGLVALAGVFLAFMQIFLDQGFSTAIVQRQDLEPEHLDTAFWTNVTIALLMTLLSMVAARLAANLFHQPELAPIIRWLSLGFLFSGFNGVQGAIFTRNLNFRTLTIRSLIAVMVGGSVGVLMALMGFGVWSLVGQSLTGSLVGVLVLWTASDWRPGFNYSVRHLKDLFSFGINVVAMSFLGFLNTRLDDLLIGYFLGPVALGYYSVAYRLLRIMTQLLSGISSQVALPTFARLQKEPQKIVSAFYNVTQLTGLIVFPCFLGVATLAPELVRTLFGGQWLPSIPVMQILSFIGIIWTIYSFNGIVIMAMGKPSWKLQLDLLNTTVNVIGFVIAVHWGIVAVALAFTIRGYLLAPLRIWQVHKLIHIDVIKYFSQYAPPLLASIVMVSTIFGIKYFFAYSLNLPILLVVCILVGAAVYAISILLLAPKLFHKVLDLAFLAMPVKMGAKR